MIDMYSKAKPTTWHQAVQYVRDKTLAGLKPDFISYSSAINCMFWNFSMSTSC